MDEIEFPFEDVSGMTRDANYGEVATAQLFGIIVHWMDFDAESEKGYSPGPDKLFVIGCIVCEQGMSFGFTAKMLETVNGGKDTLEQQGYRAYAQQASCQHFEQFDAFTQELDKETKHSLMLASAISLRAERLSLA